MKLVAAIFGVALALRPAIAPADPLPSWNDGKTKQAIVDFVAKVTKEGSPDFVPVAERIATFDNDGTLWTEQPVIQGAFLMYQLNKMAQKTRRSDSASPSRLHSSTTRTI
jgi:hypothetical protein